MHDFENRLKAATKGVGLEYFQLPVAGKESPIYRERCYCYELYHQLRKDWPDCAYRLCGEIDKSGHPIVRGNDLDNTKPDFIIHIPEDMDHNFAVIEVKPINGARHGIEKDVRTLLAYLNDGGYERAFYLIYGSADEGEALREAATQVKQQAGNRIELWHHRAPCAAAEPINMAMFDV